MKTILETGKFEREATNFKFPPFPYIHGIYMAQSSVYSLCNQNCNLDKFMQSRSISHFRQER